MNASIQSIQQRIQEAEDQLSLTAIDNRVHYIHDPNRTFTIAYIVTDRDDSKKTITVDAAIGLVNGKDNDHFCRRQGRLVSSRKLACNHKTLKDYHRLLNVSIHSSNINGGAYPTDAEQWRTIEYHIQKLFLNTLPHRLQKWHLPYKTATAL